MMFLKLDRIDLPFELFRVSEHSTTFYSLVAIINSTKKETYR